ncbi:MAG: carboxypeptidase-like regulatory domain-containing protein, partial [Hymenobacter sp.]
MSTLLTRFFYCLTMLALLGLRGRPAWAQTTPVSGTVTDVKTRQPLPYVSVAVPPAGVGVITDENGHYTLPVPAPHTAVVFAYLGYRTVTKTIVPGQPQTLNVALITSSATLGEVVIRGVKPPRYKNKDNPATALIRQVIAHKAENRPESYAYVQDEKYEKMAFSLSNLSDKFKNKKIFKNYQFLFKKQDSAATGGVNILPIYLEEKLSREYYRRQPEARKVVELGNKQVQFDKQFIDNEGISAYFNRMYQDVDMYANNVSLLGNQLLSPIAGVAPTLYEYYITDTLKQHNPQLIELTFNPRNRADMLFKGKLYVTLDGHYAVQQAYLTIDRRINLNFVKSLEARLEFAENPDRRYHLSRSVLDVDFGLAPGKGSGFYGRRTVLFTNYLVDQAIPDEVFASQPKAQATAADSVNTRSDAFWQQNRPDSLSAVERTIYKNVDTLQTIKSFRRTLTLFTFVLSGYKGFGPFEVGPANTFYSFNPVEGFRLRLGGRTTTELSSRVYFETYGAYGFKDEQWKYFLSSTYSLNNKSIYKFPQNFVRASFQRDTRIPGQELEFVQEDNFLLSFKRGVNDRYIYNDVYRLDYVHEFSNHFSYALGFRKLQQTPAGGLYFRTASDDAPQTITTLTTSELTLTLRWAPNEQFYQGKLYRTPIITPNPVFSLRLTTGLKGLVGGEYTYENVLANVTKRVYLSQLGHADVTLEGGYIFGQVPWPLLDIHRANQTFSYQLNSYNLMNFLEFASDHYASLFIDQNFNGFFFNKLPLVRRLKLREVASLKLLYGGVRDENNPNLHPGLYQFLRADQGLGEQQAFTLGRQPYAEASVGVANIFKLFRLDLVKRLT